MKRLLLTLAILATVVANSFAQMIPNTAHISMLNARIATGKYRVKGDLFTNSPAEYTDMLMWAKRLRKNQYVLATYGDTAGVIWGGYPCGYIDSCAGGGYPRYQGMAHDAASMMFAMTGDTSYGNAVVRSLMREATLVPPSGYKGAFVSDLPALPITTNGSRKPNAFSFSNEAVWQCRLNQAAARVRSLFTPEQWAIYSAYSNSWANYLGLLISSRMATSGMPNYLALDMSNRSGIYTDNFPPDSKVLYYSPTTGVGPRAMGSGQAFGNVYASFVQCLSSNYLLTGNAASLTSVRAFVNAWLFFAVYPDGTTAESVRNGDYKNPARGAVWYQAIVVEAILEAELSLRQRGATIMDISQMGGTAQTIVLVGTKPKNIKLVLDRYLTYFTFSDPHYNASPYTCGTAIFSPYCGTPPSQYGDDYNTNYVNIFGMAQAIYADTTYRKASIAQVSGMVALPSGGYSPAREQQSWFNGTGSQIWPGIYSVWSNQDLSGAYSTSLAIIGGGIKPFGTKSAQLQASGAASYKWERVAADATWRISSTTGSFTTIQPANGTTLGNSNGTSRTYRLRCTAKLGNGSTVVQTVDVTILGS